jgi:hypothetical protein
MSLLPLCLPCETFGQAARIAPFTEQQEVQLQMCPLRRVDDEQAGPDSLGILVPPGRRTFLILRPRSLSWDLVLTRAAGGQSFRDMNRDEAQVVSSALFRALTRQSGRLEETASPKGAGYWLCAHVGVYALLVCSRRPGQPYEPIAFPDIGAARAAMAQLLPILFPPQNREQQCYFNTRHFAQ